MATKCKVCGENIYQDKNSEWNHKHKSKRKKMFNALEGKQEHKARPAGV